MSAMSDRDAARKEASYARRTTVRRSERETCEMLSVPELVDVLIARSRTTNGFDFLTRKQRANLMLALLGDNTQ